MSDMKIWEALKRFFSKKGGGSGIPDLYVKFWWPLFLALKTQLFLAKSDILIPKCTEGGYLKFINQESSCTLNDTKNI